jgi:hypothetical protein
MFTKTTFTPTCQVIVLAEFSYKQHFSQSNIMYFVQIKYYLYYGICSTKRIRDLRLRFHMKMEAKMTNSFR